MSTLSISLVPGALPEDGDQITNEVLRSIARPTVQLTGSIGTASVDDGAVTTAKLADGVLSADATGRAKMADGFTTAAKLASDAVTTAKILDANVTPAKLSESVLGSVPQYATGALSAGVYAVTLSPAPTAYTAGMVVRFKADLVNTGATDLNVNSLGAKNLFTLDGKELLAGQIPAGALIEATYDGTQFQCNLRSRFASTEYTIATGAIADTAHGLGAQPPAYKVKWVLVCKTTDAGYAVGDEVPVEQFTASGYPVFAPGANATNVFLGCERTNPTVITKTGSNLNTAITSSRWKAKCYAEL